MAEAVRAFFVLEHLYNRWTDLDDAAAKPIEKGLSEAYDAALYRAPIHMATDIEAAMKFLRWIGPGAVGLDQLLARVQAAARKLAALPTAA